MDLLEELNALKADHAAAQNLLEEVNAAKASFDSVLAEKDASLATLAALVEEKNGALAAKDLELAAKVEALSALQADLESLKSERKSAEQKANELVANLGVAPIKLDQNTKAEGKSRAEVLAALHAIKDPVEFAKYYKAHKAEIFG